MKAVILAGGRGKRLKPISDYIPKPLIPINNVPIIEWQIRYMKKNGIKEFLICTGYKTEQIEDFLQVKNNFGVKIKIIKEKTALGTGGAIKNARKFLKNESFFVMNGDIITNIDLKKLKGKTNSIAAIQLKTNFGILNTKNNKIINFSEKKILADLWMNAGIYYLTSKILKDFPSKGDIEKTTFPKYAKKSNLNMVKSYNVFWHSIDSHKDIEECSKNITSTEFEKYISK